MTKLTKKQKDVLERIERNCGVDINYDIDRVGLPYDIDEMMELLQERIYENEVIYYHNAIEYLKENDPSLQESIAIFMEFGYDAETLADLNSEKLATLHMQQAQSEALYELRDDIEDAFHND